MDKRQSGVDEAIHNYRNTVDGELSRVQAARKANRQQFIDQMNTMINQAKADCNTTDGTIVSRQELLKAVTVAKETSAEDRMELENATKLIRQSHQDNKQQIGLAFTQFRESVEQARQQLVDVIGGLLQ